MGLTLCAFGIGSLIYTATRARAAAMGDAFLEVSAGDRQTAADTLANLRETNEDMEALLRSEAARTAYRERLRRFNEAANDDKQ
jgi:hypothetical protein